MADMEKLGTSVQRVTSSSKSLTSATAEHYRKTILATERTKILLDCFRTGGANSPETFVTAIAATLARYPDQVIYEVTEPETGLPAQLTWMPTIKDVRDACERAVLPIRNAQEREKRIAEQLAAREQPIPQKPTLQDLKAKYGENWGLDQPNTVKTLEERKAETQSARAKAMARVALEYHQAGVPMPSKYALSPAALKEMKERDEFRAELLNRGNST